jgi:type IV pilus assembly protein PilA
VSQLRVEAGTRVASSPVYPAREYTQKERDFGANLQEIKISKIDKGVTLIEFLIVVANNLIIAAIAIPNLLRSRMAANEASAVGSIRTVNTAEVTFNSTYNDGFANTLPLLGGAAGAAATCNNAEIIDPVLSAANPSIKSGYNFQVGPGTVAVAAAPAGCANPGFVDGYTVIGWPVNVGTTGQRSFCSDGSGVIQSLSTGVKPAPAPPLCPAGMTPLSQ